jgi:sensor histidine kinase regulating citrate/malate metabolism
MNDITDRFNRMKIGTKILIICLILVIVPTLVIRTVAIVTKTSRKKSTTPSNGMA